MILDVKFRLCSNMLPPNVGLTFGTEFLICKSPITFVLDDFFGSFLHPSIFTINDPRSAEIINLDSTLIC